MNDIPADLEQMIKDIVAHVESEKKSSIEDYEPEYLYDYVDEEVDHGEHTTVIKIDL